MSGWAGKEHSIVLDSIADYLPSTTPTHPDKDSPLNLCQWRELAPDGKLCMANLALATMEAESNGEYKLVPFVFNLSTALHQCTNATKNKSEIAYLRHRLHTSLKRALNREPDFWLSLEMAPKANTGKPHMQGALLLKPSEAKRAVKAFHRINGEVSRHFKHYALRFLSGKRRAIIAERGQLYAELNWALYCTKERGRVAIQYIKRPQHGRKKTIAITRLLQQRAEQLYSELRRAHKARLTALMESGSE